MLTYEDFAKLGQYLYDLSTSVIAMFHVRYKAMLLHR